MNSNSQEALELVSKGIALYSVDNYEEAVKQLNEAISVDPYCEAAYENLGVCFIMMDKYADAKVAFKKLLLLKKNNGLAYFHLGNIALLTTTLSWRLILLPSLRNARSMIKPWNNMTKPLWQIHTRMI